MEEYLSEMIDYIREISDETRDKYYSSFIALKDKLIKILNDIFKDEEMYDIYPVSDTDYGTSLEDLTPFRVLIEFRCKKSDVIARKEYIKIKNKPKIKNRDRIKLNALEEQAQNTLLDVEIAERVYKSLSSETAIGFKCVVRENCILVKTDTETNLVFIIGYRFDDSEYTEFTYKSVNYKYNYDTTINNLLDKNSRTNGAFFNTVQLYKFIECLLLIKEKITYTTHEEFDFYENLLYNVPDELFGEEHYYNIVYSLNYLNNTKLSELKNADDVPMTYVNNEKALQRKINLLINNFNLFSKCYNEEDSQEEDENSDDNEEENNSDDE